MNQMHIYLLTFLLQNYNKKETTTKLLKVNDIIDAESSFLLQKLNSIFKICFNQLQFIIPGCKESAIFT